MATVTKFCHYCMTPVNEGEACPACGLTSLSYDPSPHHLPPGTVLMDRYVIGRVLGEGGFGITYIGCDLRLELRVAIKEYFPTDKVTRHAMASLDVTTYVSSTTKSYEEGKLRFLSEARTMARMDKQSEIVGVRDFFEANRTAYIVMEYIDGTTLKELVAQKGGKIPPAEFFDTVKPLFGALTAMHSIGLIHRDISPDNLMLEKGRLRLIDFGCARESVRGTETMTIALKHGFAPIEQYQHKGQGPWTDVYALSATMYYCLTGKLPPPSLDRLLDDELIPPTKLGIEISQKTEQAILYGMGVRPKKRFQSAEELYGAMYPIKPPIDPWIERFSVNFKAFTEKAGSFFKGLWAKKETKLTALILAILIILGTVAAVIPWGDIFSGNGDGTEDIGAHTSSDIGADTEKTPSESDEVKDTDKPENPFAGALQVGSNVIGSQFISYLEDDSIPSIIVSGGFHFTSGEIIIDKPVKISGSGGLNFGVPLHIVDGGYIIIENTRELCIESIVYITGSGYIEVLYGGCISGNGSVIADSEENLILQSGAKMKLQREKIIYTNEEKIFTNATVVTNNDELARVISEGVAYSVIIDGDITVSEYNYFGRPIKILEGSTVTIPDGYDWNIGDNEFYNYGTVKGRVWSNDFVVNYGTIEASMTLDTANNGMLINYGRLEVTDFYAKRYNVINIGEFLHIDSGRESGSSFENCTVKNHGTMSVSGKQSNLYLYAMTNLNNTGTLTAENGAGITHDAQIYNTGAIVISDGCYLNGYGIIEHDGRDLTVRGTENLKFSGVILYAPSNRRDIKDVSIGCRLIPFTWSSNSGVRVNNELSVGSTMKLDDVDLIVITNMEMSDVVFTKNIACDGKMTVNGDLTLDGVYFVTGELEVKGKIILKNGAVMINRGDTTCNWLLVHDGSMLYDLGHLNASETTEINGSSYIYNGYGVTLTSDITLTDSELISNGNISFEGNIEISENSTVTVGGGVHYNFAENTKIKNYGSMDLHGYSDDPIYIGADIENRGSLRIGHTPILSGSIVNYAELIIFEKLTVTGHLENRDYVSFWDGAGRIVIDGGTVIGVD